MFFEHYGMDDIKFFKILKFSVQSYPLHFHRVFELIHVKAGCVEMLINEKQQRFHKGESAVVFPGQLHDLRTCEESEVVLLLFSSELIQDFYQEYGRSVPLENKLVGVVIDDSKKFENLYSKKSFLYQLCNTMTCDLKFIEKKHSKKTKAIYKILSHIEEHHSKGLTLHSVAEKLNYDYTYLSKLFAQTTEMTFTEYLNHFRVAKAKKLLEDTEKSVAEIASECGFRSYRTFNRNFKSITQTTPSEYRIECHVGITKSSKNH